MQNDNLKNYIHLHFIVFVWGFTAILRELISLESVALVCWRMGIAATCVFIYAKFAKINLILDKNTILKLLLTGCVIAMHWFTFFEAISVSNISITLACLSTGAFFASLIEPILTKQKFNFTDILFGVFAIIGLCFIANSIQTDGNSFCNELFSGENNNFKGILIGLSSAFLSALFAVLNSGFVKKENAVAISFYELFGGFLCFTLILVFINKIDLSFFNIKTSDFLWVLILATVCTAYALIASVGVMKHLSAFTVMLTTNLEPVYGIVLALILFTQKEQMKPSFYVGTSIILVTVIVNGLLRLRKKSN